MYRESGGKTLCFGQTTAEIKPAMPFLYEAKLPQSCSDQDIEDNNPDPDTSP
jgi:hypothetical protein